MSPCTTTVTPRASVHSSSSAAMSNETLVVASHTDPGPAVTWSSMACRKFVSARCGTVTPFGVPVEPDV